MQNMSREEIKSTKKQSLYPQSNFGCKDTTIFLYYNFWKTFKIKKNTNTHIISCIILTFRQLYNITACKTFHFQTTINR